MCQLKENSITIYRLKVIPFAKYYKTNYGHTVKPRLTTISFTVFIRLTALGAY